MVATTGSVVVSFEHTEKESQVDQVDQVQARN